MRYPEGLPLHNIWEEIAYILDSTKDLLSLALTCRIFKELIIPDHLEYRYIRCDLCRTNVWMSLCDRPRLARSIRFLEFICESDSISRLPQTLSSAPSEMHRMHRPTDQDLTMIMNSLSKMTFLKSFVWTPQSPISAQAVFDILHTITTKVQFLEELSVDLFQLKFFSKQALLDNRSIWSLTNLTKVNLRYPVPAAVQMVIYCPNIEDLRVVWPPPAPIFLMMQDSHWKRLQRLNLVLNQTLAAPSRPVGEDDIPTIITSFFDRHPNLESLYFTPFDVRILKLPSTCLPNLRSAGGILSILQPLRLTSFLSDDIMSRLVHWRIPIDNIDIDALPQLDKLESFYPPLDSDDGYLPDSFFSFLMKAPNLRKINLEIDIGTEYTLFTRGCRGPDAKKSLIDSLLGCSSLTHAFCNFRLPPITDTYESLSISPACTENSSKTDFRQDPELLYEKLSVLRALKYLRVVLGEDKKFVKLERDEDGIYSGYQFVTSKDVGGCPSHWGNFFFGL